VENISETNPDWVVYKNNTYRFVSKSKDSLLLRDVYVNISFVSSKSCICYSRWPRTAREGAIEEKTEETKAELKYLSGDMWEMVFRFVPVKQLLQDVALVCSEWNSYSSRPDLWHLLCLDAGLLGTETIGKYTSASAPEWKLVFKELHAEREYNQWLLEIGRKDSKETRRKFAKQEKEDKRAKDENPFALFFRHIDMHDYTKLLSQLLEAIHNIYGKTELWQESIAEAILLLSFSGISFPSPLHIRGVSQSELETRYGMTFRQEGDQAILEIPYVFASIINDHFKVLPPARFPWVTAQGYVQGSKFEDVDGVAEELRSRAMQMLYPGKKISFAEYYRGAWGAEDILKTKFHLPPQSKFIKSVRQFCHPTAEHTLNLVDFSRPELSCYDDFDRGRVISYKWQEGYII